MCCIILGCSGQVVGEQKKNKLSRSKKMMSQTKPSGFKRDAMVSLKTRRSQRTRCHKKLSGFTGGRQYFIKGVNYLKDIF